MGIIKGEFQRKIIFHKVFLEWGRTIRYDFFERKKNLDGGGRRGHCKLLFSLHVWAKRALQVRGRGATRRGELRRSICKGNGLLSLFCFHHMIVDFPV